MPDNTPPSRNPHASAAGAYGHMAQKTTNDPREIEARALLKSVSKMQDLQRRWGQTTPEELDDVLRFNRQIWMMFVDNAAQDEDNARTQQLRSNITNLGAYVFKRTLDIISEPKSEKFDILIDINREIAAGLMTKPKAE